MTMQEKLSAALDEVIGIGMDNNVDMKQIAAMLRRKADELEKDMAELPA